MRREKTVVRAILYDTRDRVLLARRVKKGSEYGKYALIGGRVENETLEEAVIREVKEETGLEIQGPTFIKDLIDTTSVEGETWRVCYFSGSVTGDLNLKEDEITDAGFFDKRNIKDIEIGFDHYDRIVEFWETIST